MNPHEIIYRTALAKLTPDERHVIELTIMGATTSHMVTGSLIGIFLTLVIGYFAL